MKEVISAKKWIVMVLAFTAILLTGLAVVTWIIDPFLYYRIPSHKVMVTPRYVTTGLLQNGTYDTALIGSSMIENFDMKSFREKLNWNACKLTIGGINIPEIEMLFTKALNKPDIERIILNIDLISFNYLQKESIRYLDYLYNDTKLDDFKYWWNYEVWRWYIPMDLGINLGEKIGVHLPESIVKSTNIDKIGYWGDDYKFGQQVVKANYLGNMYSVSQQNTDGMYQRMIKNFDQFYAKTIFQSNQKEIIIIFPPYSALFWYQAGLEGYADTLLIFKEYLVKKVAKLGNVKIYDFQSMPFIVNLDLYKDTTHYHPSINERMVDELGKEDWILTVDNLDDRNAQLEDLIRQFRDENNNWLHGEV